MDNTDKIKSEIRAILDSATDKELTKQWIVEALDEGLQLKPDSANSKSEALNPTITLGTNHYRRQTLCFLGQCVMLFRVINEEWIQGVRTNGFDHTVVSWKIIFRKNSWKLRYK